MPPENNGDQQLDGTPGTGDGGAAPAASTGAPVLTLSPESVRNSPEYQALQQELRNVSRAQGRERQQNADALAAAETRLAAAEAERQQAMLAQLGEILGEEGVAQFNEISELSQSDPMAAARRFKELTTRVAQSEQAGQPPAPAGQGEGDQVPPDQQQQSAQSTPPPPGTGVSGDAPLGQPTTGIDWDQIATDADKAYAEVVQRNQDPVTRSRVTDRDRAGGFMSWLSSAYVRGMKAAGRLPR